MRRNVDMENGGVANLDCTRMRIIQPLIFVLVLVLSTYGHAGEITFEADGRRNITCACIAATSGCASRFFHAASGSQRREWVSTANARRGRKLDLTMYCYRKRDVAGEGDGLCCLGSNESESLKMFHGALQK
jgi:hypothetical protein